MYTKLTSVIKSTRNFFKELEDWYKSSISIEKFFFINVQRFDGQFLFKSLQHLIFEGRGHIFVNVPSKDEKKALAIIFVYHFYVQHALTHHECPKKMNFCFTKENVKTLECVKKFLLGFWLKHILYNKEIDNFKYTCEQQILLLKIKISN